MSSLKGKNSLITFNSNKKKHKKSKRSRSSADVSQHRNLSARPAWNCNTQDNPHGLTSTELEHRRQQRISKNLAKAQVELYDKMARNRWLQSQSSIGHENPSCDRPGKHNPYEFLDLKELLRRSEEILKESHELLSTNLSERKISKINFTGMEEIQK